jgi:DNA-3-methyladenine glycosylase
VTRELSAPARSPATATLPVAFYDRPVLEVARDLIGCVVTHGVCSGFIVETEAYHDIEPASHAFGGLTPRNEILFGPPGRAYVYRSYGVHAMLNAVAEASGVGAGVLIRALEPVGGVESMAARRGFPPDRLRDLCSGPGKLTQALGIGLDLNGSSLQDGPIVFTRRPPAWKGVVSDAGLRIGITRAVELPWRFTVRGSRFLSAPLKR